jgi:hypothetical protein
LQLHPALGGDYQSAFLVPGVHPKAKGNAADYRKSQSYCPDLCV